MNAQREAVHHLARPELRESFGDLLGDLMTQSSDLVRDENKVDSSLSTLLPKPALVRPRKSKG